MLDAWPNTSLYTPNTVIPAVRYDIPAGVCKLATRGRKRQPLKIHHAFTPPRLAGRGGMAYNHTRTSGRPAACCAQHPPRRPGGAQEKGAFLL